MSYLIFLFVNSIFIILVYKIQDFPNNKHTLTYYRHYLLAFWIIQQTQRKIIMNRFFYLIIFLYIYRTIGIITIEGVKSSLLKFVNVTVKGTNWRTQYLRYSLIWLNQLSQLILTQQHWLPEIVFREMFGSR